MNVTLTPAVGADFKNIKRLFVSAFPPEERPPFFIVKRKAAAGKGQMLAAKDSGVFVGFVSLIRYQDLIYLFFFAVDPRHRGKGYGSHILRLLQNQFKNNRIFLARETLDAKAPNYDQRVKRHQFYLKNGFADLPCKIKEGGVTYDVMSCGGLISASEYNALISAWSGKFLKKLIDMRAIE